MKLNIFLRTCDNTSLQDNRLVPKAECIITCLNSLIKSLINYNSEWHLTIIDDNSSDLTKSMIMLVINTHNVTQNISLLSVDPNIDKSELNNKQKSRISVKILYDTVYSLPDDELVYIIEDDYLHYIDSISNMINAYHHFKDVLINTDIGIFPQDFNQLYLDNKNPFNDIYVTPCYVLPGPDRYYRSTWFTHESFLLESSVFKRYKEDFDSLLSIGTQEGAWEGNTISNIWKYVAMLMPLKTLAIHLGAERDISNFVEDWEEIYNSNKL
jgi:hypothetical protein